MAIFGAFGKIPALGDFFRLDLPRGFVEPWDLWLQSGMIAARETLGDRWTDCYMSAPLWRFTLSENLAGSASMSGVMMASVDRVGRRFPLTLAVLTEGGAGAGTHFSNDAMFADLEQVALDALEDDMTREALRTSLDGVVSGTLPRTGKRAHSGGLCVQTSGGLSNALAAEFAARSFKTPSLWSTVLPEGERMLLCEGLPNPVQFTGLLDLDAPMWSSPNPTQGG